MSNALPTTRLAAPIASSEPLELHPLVRPSLRQLSLPEAAARYRRGVTERLFTNPHAAGDCDYPSPRPLGLQARYAELLCKDVALHGGTATVSRDNVLFTAGSIAAVDLLVRAFCDPRSDAIALTSPTAPLYRHLATAAGVAVHDVPLRGPSFDQLDVDGLANVKAKLIFLSNPNSPVGSLIPIERIAALAARCRGLVVVDEAYIEFADARSCVSLVQEQRNVVVLRTFSKAWGLAGLRAGAVVAPLPVHNALRLLQDPFAFHAAAQRAVEERLGDELLMQAWTRSITAAREWVAGALARLPAVKRVYASHANFLCVEVHDVEALYARCVAAELLVADLSHQLPDTLRVSIGARDDNARLVDVLAG